VLPNGAPKERKSLDTEMYRIDKRFKTYTHTERERNTDTQNTLLYIHIIQTLFVSFASVVRSSAKSE
jgi:hypothetical protein